MTDTFKPSDTLRGVPFFNTAEPETNAEIALRIREVSSLTPGQLHMYGAIRASQGVHGQDHTSALLEARKLDPAIGIDDLQAAARRHIAEKNPQMAAAMERRERRAALRVAMRKDT